MRRVFDHGALHAEADAEEGHAFLAGVADGLDFALDAALAEAAGHEEAVVAGKEPLGAFGFDVFAADAADANLGPMGDAGVVERFVNRFVGVVMFGVFADERDVDFVLGVAEPTEQLVPIFQDRARRS